MADLIYYIVFGVGVGLAVGLTGVGGGSLMTPILILHGIPTKVAIGTDLLYASATKASALWSHQRAKTVRWRTVLLLASGSIPSSILVSYLLKQSSGLGVDYSQILQVSLGAMLIVTSLVVLFKARIQREAADSSKHSTWMQRHSDGVSIFAGVMLGIVVTLSSVGAGAFCAALLLTLFPKLPAMNVVGTDIAHAVPLTLIAGLGHMWNGHIDWFLLAGLLIGSLPAVHLGAKLAANLPNSVLQSILAVLLFGIGLKFTIGL